MKDIMFAGLVFTVAALAAFFLIQFDELAIEHLAIYGWIMRGLVWLLAGILVIVAYEAMRKMLTWNWQD